MKSSAAVLMGVVLFLVLARGALASEPAPTVYVPVAANGIFTDRVEINVTTIGADSDTFLYALDFVFIDGGLIYVWWGDLVNGCYLGATGACQIVVNERIIAGGRDGWIFVTSTNLERLVNMRMASNYLLDTGVAVYDFTADFQGGPISFPTPELTPAGTPLPTKTPTPMPTPTPAPTARLLQFFI